MFKNTSLSTSIKILLKNKQLVIYNSSSEDNIFKIQKVIQKRDNKIRSNRLSYYSNLQIKFFPSYYIDYNKYFLIANSSGKTREKVWYGAYKRFIPGKWEKFDIPIELKQADSLLLDIYGTIPGKGSIIFEEATLIPNNFTDHLQQELQLQISFIWDLFKARYSKQITYAKSANTKKYQYTLSCNSSNISQKTIQLPLYAGEPPCNKNLIATTKISNLLIWQVKVSVDNLEQQNWLQSMLHDIKLSSVKDFFDVPVSNYEIVFTVEQLLHQIDFPNIRKEKHEHQN